MGLCCVSMFIVWNNNVLFTHILPGSFLRLAFTLMLQHQFSLGHSPRSLDPYRDKES